MWAVWVKRSSPKILTQIHSQNLACLYMFTISEIDGHFYIERSPDPLSLSFYKLSIDIQVFWWCSLTTFDHFWLALPSILFSVHAGTTVVTKCLCTEGWPHFPSAADIHIHVHMEGLRVFPPKYEDQCNRAESMPHSLWFLTSGMKSGWNGLQIGAPNATFRIGYPLFIPIFREFTLPFPSIYLSLF